MNVAKQSPVTESHSLAVLSNEALNKISGQKSYEQGSEMRHVARISWPFQRTAVGHQATALTGSECPWRTTAVSGVEFESPGIPSGSAKTLSVLHIREVPSSEHDAIRVPAELTRIWFTSSSCPLLIGMSANISGCTRGHIL